MPGPWQRAILHIQLANNQTKLVLKPSQWEHRKKKNSELRYRCWPSGITWSPCCQIKPRLHRKGRYPKQASNLLKGDKYLPSSVSTWCCKVCPLLPIPTNSAWCSRAQQCLENLSQSSRGHKPFFPQGAQTLHLVGCSATALLGDNRKCYEYQSS